MFMFIKNNKLEKIPSGAFSSLPHLRELYLQNNLLTNSGMDNTTFRSYFFITLLLLTNPLQLSIILYPEQSIYSLCISFFFFLYTFHCLTFSHQVSFFTLGFLLYSFITLLHIATLTI